MPFTDNATMPEVREALTHVAEGGAFAERHQAALLAADLLLDRWLALMDAPTAPTRTSAED